MKDKQRNLLIDLTIFAVTIMLMSGLVFAWTNFVYPDLAEIVPQFSDSITCLELGTLATCLMHYRIIEKEAKRRDVNEVENQS